MNKYEALQLLGLTGDVTNADIKRAYKRKARQFHPDRNPAGSEIMKLINVAYNLVKNEDKVKVYENTAMANYPEILATALEAILHLGLTIEVCGSWVWVSGDTKPHKGTLKAAGYRWSPTKTKWYYRPECHKAFKRRKSDEWSMDKIRDTYGSTEPEQTQRARLS